MRFLNKLASFTTYAVVLIAGLLFLRSDYRPTAETLTAENLVATSALVTSNGATESFGGDMNMNSHRIVNALAFDATHSGVVPASGGGTATYLRADGTWASVTGTTASSAWFGPGTDGDITLDGSTTVLGMVPAGNVYTATRDIQAHNLTINSGVKLFMANWALQVSGTLTNNGTIHNNGKDGQANSNTGLSTPSGRWYQTVNAQFQNVGAGTTTSVAGVPKYFFTAGAGGVTPGGSGHAGTGDGGAGGTDNAGNAGANGGSTTLLPQTQIVSLDDLWNGYAQTWNSSPGISIRLLQFGSAGGSGGFHSFCAADAGGGGAGGGMCWVAAQKVTGTGAIQARGGIGAAGGCPGASGGGGGGGMVVFIYETQTGQTVDANGGLAQTPTNGGSKGGDGGSGAVWKNCNTCAGINLSGDGT